MSAAKTKRRAKGIGSKGIAYVKSTFNNTLVTLCDTQGNVIAQGSPGAVGYKGSRKSTPFAAQQAGIRAGEAAYKLGLREIVVRVKGPGSGRESAVRGLSQAGLRVSMIEDITPLPHNGCRPSKKRRV
ncbi:MAG: 30S ribosomal protein S11 [Planctomycetes bacterium]|nr:30S ribosomal protein S11 [Planctomycetota bacterium]